MDANRKRFVALAGLLVVLVAVIGWQWNAEPAATAARAAGASRRSTAAKAPPAPLPQVELSLLDRPRSEPADTARDPFKFESRRRREAADEVDPGGARPAGTRPAGAPGGPGAAPALPVSTEPPGPPPPPPIPLKFIGLVQTPGENGKIAVLSDGRGIYHGREGDVVEGRYRIVRIGNESVEMVYLDGRGRQVIRLSGA